MSITAPDSVSAPGIAEASPSRLIPATADTPAGVWRRRHPAEKPGPVRPGLRDMTARRIPVGGFLALCALLLVACAAAGENRGGSDPAVIDAALAFSGLSLPTGATVLGVRHTGALDPLYEIAVSAPPATADRMLRDARVLPDLTTSRVQFMSPMDGFSVEPGPAVLSAEDALPAGGSRPSTVFREFYVNRSDPARTFVYVWAFST